MKYLKCTNYRHKNEKTPGKWGDGYLEFLFNGFKLLVWNEEEISVTDSGDGYNMSRL